ncbi:hypothetical protein MN0502_12910 [Arthrobacter sp. MN05-02]|nr:hypothetical protein MN0502_12910 [Arthrobacter sp. MN05-02]
MGSCLTELLLRIQCAGQACMDLEEHLGMLGDGEIRERPEDGRDLVDLAVPGRGRSAVEHLSTAVVEHPSHFLQWIACHSCALTHRT